MSKRKYTKMDKYAARITALRGEGRTRQEIADELGLDFEQVANWIKKNNRKKRNLAQGIMPNPKGRPRKQSELEQLRMENKLLRDFLQFTGRMWGQE